MSTAAYWGLIWGWLPAVLAARPLLRQAASTGPIGSAARGASANKTDSAARGASANKTDSAARRYPAAVESGAPESPNPEGEPWCTGGDTAVVLGGGDAATGHRAQELRISNTGEADCLLARYPGIAFDDEGGSAMSVLVFRGGTFMTRPRAGTGHAAAGCLGPSRAGPERDGHHR